MYDDYLGEYKGKVIVLDDLSAAARWNVPAHPSVVFIEPVYNDRRPVQGNSAGNSTW